MHINRWMKSGHSCHSESQSQPQPQPTLAFLSPVFGSYYTNSVVRTMAAALLAQE